MGEEEERLVSGRGEECAQDIVSTYMKSRLNTTHCNKIKFESFFLILITYYCLIKFPQIWYLETTIIDLLHPGKNPSMLQPSETRGAGGALAKLTQSPIC